LLAISADHPYWHHRAGSKPLATRVDLAPILLLLSVLSHADMGYDLSSDNGVYPD
jgi:hypothetical protein